MGFPFSYKVDSPFKLNYQAGRYGYDVCTTGLRYKNDGALKTFIAQVKVNWR